MHGAHMMRPDAGADQHRQPRAAGGRAGLFEYPADLSADAQFGARVYAFDASAIANGLGNIRLGNTVMLGAIADHLPFSAEVLERCGTAAPRRRASR